MCLPQRPAEAGAGLVGGTRGGWQALPSRDWASGVAPEQQGLTLHCVPSCALGRLPPPRCPAAWRKQAHCQPTQLPSTAARPRKENEILFPMLLSSAKTGKSSKRSKRPWKECKPLLRDTGEGRPWMPWFPPTWGPLLLLQALPQQQGYPNHDWSQP